MAMENLADTPVVLPSSNVTYHCNSINGTLRLPCITEQSMEELNKGFQAREGDVFIATYPKSGTTWLQQIVKLIRSGGVDDRSSPTRFTWVEVNGLEALQAATSPRFMQTHLGYSSFPGIEPALTPAKFIYVARNPKDVAVSYYYHTLGFELYQYEGDWDDFFERFIAGQVTDGDWFDHVVEWWKHKDAKNILFLKYEDIKKDHRGTVELVSEFIGYKLDSKAIDMVVQHSTFDYMRDNPATNFTKGSLFARKEGCVPFIRKGIVGDWKNMFTVSQSQRMNDKYTDRIVNKTDLEFEFK